MHSATSTDDHPLADPHLKAIALQDASIVAALLGSGLDDSRKVIGGLIERVGALPQVDMPVTHHFAPHVYGRECFIPKGTVAVGKIHRTQHLSVMLRGDMTFLTKRGLQRISGSCVMPLAGPFTQRAVYAHEDTVLLTIHPTDSTDLALIEGEVIAPDWAEVDALDVESFALDMLGDGGARIDSVRSDYGRFLAEYGFTEQAVRSLVEDMTDHIDMPEGFDAHMVANSMIQGVGTFARRAIKGGSPIAPARVSSRRTVVGRRTNHSPTPNCIFERFGVSDLMLVALRDIPAGEELTIDYRQAGAVNGWGRVPDPKEVLLTQQLRSEAANAANQTGDQL